jgi:hypothetical protein
LGIPEQLEVFMETLERIICTGHNDSFIDDEWLWEWAKNNLPILEMTAHEVSAAMRAKAEEQAPNERFSRPQKRPAGRDEDL